MYINVELFAEMPLEMRCRFLANSYSNYKETFYHVDEKSAGEITVKSYPCDRVNDNLAIVFLNELFKTYCYMNNMPVIDITKENDLFYVKPSNTQLYDSSVNFIAKEGFVEMLTKPFDKLIKIELKYNELISEKLANYQTKQQKRDEMREVFPEVFQKEEYKIRTFDSPYELTNFLNQNKINKSDIINITIGVKSILIYLKN